MKQKSFTRCSKQRDFRLTSLDLKQQTPVTDQKAPAESSYDLAFLDLDSANWQDRLLDIRHRMPVIAFSVPT